MNQKRGCNAWTFLFLSQTKLHFLLWKPIKELIYMYMMKIIVSFIFCLRLSVWQEEKKKPWLVKNKNVCTRKFQRKGWNFLCNERGHLVKKLLNLKTTIGFYYLDDFYWSKCSRLLYHILQFICKKNVWIVL